MSRETRVLYIRNFIFGAEDSLVSTVGLLSGIAIGGVSAREIVLTGLVLVFVEAFSMGVGSYLSEYSAQESLEGTGFKSAKAATAAAFMFLAYLLCGAVPLWPYLAFQGTGALFYSIISALAGLFALGFWSGKILNIRIMPSALRMIVIGGLAILVGTVVGELFKIS